MRRTVWSTIVLLAVGLTATVVTEELYRHRAEQQLSAEAAVRLDDMRLTLERDLASVHLLSQRFSERLAEAPDQPEPALRAQAEEITSRHSWIRSVVLSRPTVVTFVHPVQGNEALLGIDYNYRPDFIESLRTAVRRRAAVLSGPVMLMQTGRQGMILRSPVFRSGAVPEDAPLAVLSIGMDFDALLARAGFSDPDLPFQVAIRRMGDEIGGATIFGDPKVAATPRAVTIVRFFDGEWTLSAQLRPEVVDSLAHTRLIRGVGGGLTAVLVLLTVYSGRLRRASSSVRRSGSGRRFPLRLFLAGGLFLALAPAIALSGWLSYRSSGRLADNLTEDYAIGIGRRVVATVSEFFDIPVRVVRYNVGQVRAGLLSTDDKARLTASFLLQLRQQPVLTFISMGTTGGDYYAASRPPLGDDRTLRLIEALETDGRQMKLYRVGDDNRRTAAVSLGNRHYDSRTRPWFKAGATDGIHWYGAYRYAINDVAGAYDDLGFGAAAPLYGPDGSFAGVMTADLALSQLGDRLRGVTAGTAAIAFIIDGAGDLLAASTPEPIYTMAQDQVRRLNARDSSYAAVRVAKAIIDSQPEPEGYGSAAEDGERYYVHWRRVQLPDGPVLTIGVTLPQAHFSGPAQAAANNVAILGSAVLVAALALILFAADWVARPLVVLDRWCRRLADGDWITEAPVDTPVTEVRSLADGLIVMSDRQRAYTLTLEQKVAERTWELEQANRKLEELSTTDGLTGLANRRHLDQVLEREWARGGHSGHSLGVLMIDVDLFKNYNDLYGHQAGDLCLQRVAGVLAGAARRAGDLTARYGGEEFVVVLGDTDAEKSAQRAELIRAGVEALGIPHADAPLGVVTVSIGLAAVRPDRETSAQTLLRMADEALYRAKAGGRNRTVVYAAREASV